MLSFSLILFPHSQSRPQSLLIATDQRDNILTTCQSTNVESRNVLFYTSCHSDLIVRVLLVSRLVSGSLRKSRELTTFVIRTVINKWQMLLGCEFWFTDIFNASSRIPRLLMLYHWCSLLQSLLFFVHWVYLRSSLHNLKAAYQHCGNESCDLVSWVKSSSTS
jgi:hypothetical protein